MEYISKGSFFDLDLYFKRIRVVWFVNKTLKRKKILSRDELNSLY